MWIVLDFGSKTSFQADFYKKSKYCCKQQVSSPDSPSIRHFVLSFSYHVFNHNFVWNLHLESKFQMPFCVCVNIFLLFVQQLVISTVTEKTVVDLIY